MYEIEMQKIHNGYEYRIYDVVNREHICTFYGSTNAMWDWVPGAKSAREYAKEYLEYLNTKVKE